MTAEAIAKLLGKAEEAEMVFTILRHLAANPDRGIIQGSKEWVEAGYPTEEKK